MMRADSPSRDEQFSWLQADFEQWLEEHPTASLTEREQALDQRLDALRASLLTDSAHAAQQPEACPECGTQLVDRGQQQRTLTTRGGEQVPLERSYRTCPACGAGLFPPG